MHSKINRLVFLLSMVLVTLGLGACTIEPDTGPAGTPPEGTFAVDVSFRELYQLLGGESNLGFPISPLFEYQGIRYQYTEKALMQYDPLVPVSQQFSLSSLGNELGMQDQPIVLPEQPGLRIVDGYIVYDEFVPLYEALQGSRFVGRPLTQVRINYDRGRIEQYFSNVGFYRSLTDPPGTIHLLDYGAWKCDRACRHPRDPYANVIPFQVFPEPFISSLSRLGSGFAGRPLSEPYLTQDGKLEQIYENLVVFADPSTVRSIALRAITERLGFAPWALVPKIEDPRMVFYPLDGGLGHNVPTILEEYLTLHGGTEISGPPTTEIYQEGLIWRQCFTNYCLDYDPQAAESLQIRPAPLGVRYLELFPPLQAAYANLNFTTATTRLTVWEAHSLITSAQEQQISLQVVETESQTPIPNLEAFVTLTLPDGSQAVYNFQPTGADGQSALNLLPVEAPNGTLIPYQVCLKAAAGEPLCVTDSYVIWGNP